MEHKRFSLRTYGCQMNVHDSQKIENLLHHGGLRPAVDEDGADLLLINTCSIRDKAENRLYTDLGLLAQWKAERPGRVIGVGGCVAQQVGDAILSRFKQVDFVFGTHNLRLVPAMVEAALEGERSLDVSESDSQGRFDLPARHADLVGDTPGRAFVTVMEGCDMFCTFCIVPTTRGREISRPADAILDEVRALAARGVCEVTLLGQTVNAYGRHDVRRGRATVAGTMPYAELLRQVDAIPGIERIRYTSPHPLFFDEPLIRAHGELESLCPHVHLPLQSGSDAVLALMRRRYDVDRFLEIVEALRAARPDLALTTDVIVGFPGESDDDFAATLDVMERAGFVDSYSFKYSPRPDTPAAVMDGAVPPEEAQRRLAELQDAQRERTLAYHRSRVGTRTEILIDGPSRKPGQLRGRDPYHRVVNLALDPALQITASEAVRNGDRIAVDLVEATPHSLIAQLPGDQPGRDAPSSLLSIQL